MKSHFHAELSIRYQDITEPEEREENQHIPPVGQYNITYTHTITPRTPPSSPPRGFVPVSIPSESSGDILRPYLSGDEDEVLRTDHKLPFHQLYVIHARVRVAFRGGAKHNPKIPPKGSERHLVNSLMEDERVLNVKFVLFCVM